MKFQNYVSRNASSNICVQITAKSERSDIVNRQQSSPKPQSFIQLDYNGVSHKSNRNKESRKQQDNEYQFHLVPFKVPNNQKPPLLTECRSFTSVGSHEAHIDRYKRPTVSVWIGCT